jgi:hypothetical protein
MAIHATYAIYQILPAFQPGRCAFKGAAGQVPLSRANEGAQAKYFYGCRCEDDWQSDNYDKKNSYPAFHDVSPFLEAIHQPTQRRN